VSATTRQRLRVRVIHEYVVEQDVVVARDAQEKYTAMAYDEGEPVLLEHLEKRTLEPSTHSIEVEYSA
jgi:hypothetical protein